MCREEAEGPENELGSLVKRSRLVVIGIIVGHVVFAVGVIDTRRFQKSAPAAGRTP